MTEPDSYLLDTSALFAFFEGEPGAERVQQVLRSAPTLICAVSLMEVYYITLKEHDQAKADWRLALLKRSGAEILWGFDERLVLQAAAIKARHSLSLADALIAASAQRWGAILLHKDPEYDALAPVIKQERLPAKATGRTG